VQEVHALLCEELGDDYLKQIKDAWEDRPSFQRTGEYRALKKATQRALDKVRGAVDKRRWRLRKRGYCLPADVSLESLSCELGEWFSLDRCLDEKEFVRLLTSSEKQVFLLLAEGGWTKKAIAEKLRIAPQRVSEIIKKIASRFRGPYAG
jgi:hypothetical protein